MNDNSEFLSQVTAQLAESYARGEAVSFNEDKALPQRERVIAVLEEMLELVFPGYSGRYSYFRSGISFAVGEHLCRINHELAKQISQALCHRCDSQEECRSTCAGRSRELSMELLRKLPEIRELLLLDCQAALDGDPATRSKDEIILAYPGFKAICIYRIAHELYVRGIPLLPRIMSEYAHTVTGIDINPGAVIGKSFFIDHGTGVVIGETAVLGDNVKLYQGVTLGALSFPKDSCGQIIKGTKRHPNLEDNVTVYAGATILGDVTIAHHSVIGGNVWLTESISEPYSRVVFSPSEMSVIHRKPKSNS